MFVGTVTTSDAGDTDVTRKTLSFTTDARVGAIPTGSDAKPGATNHVLGAVLELPANQVLIEENIQKLAKDTLAARSAFEDISLLLLQFDGLNPKTKYGKKLPKLRTGWDALRERYNEVLEQSHKDAIAIKNVCEDYVATVLCDVDDPNMSLTEIRLSLKEFITRTNKAQFSVTVKEGRAGSRKTVASNVTNGAFTSFDRLRFDVEEYRQRIENTCLSADEDATKKKTGLGGCITSLRAQIKHQQESIDFYLRSLEFSHLVKGVGAVLTHFCPLAAIVLFGGIALEAGSAYAARAKKTDLAAHEADLAAHQAELASLAQNTEDLRGIRKQLEDSGHSFDTILYQLEALTNFWASTRADCMSIERYIETALGTTSEATLRRTLHERMAGNVYRVLQRVLSIYVSQYTSPTKSV